MNIRGVDDKVATNSVHCMSIIEPIRKRGWEISTSTES